jgi:pilus assembly protein CpaB
MLACVVLLTGPILTVCLPFAPNFGEIFPKKGGTSGMPMARTLLLLLALSSAGGASALVYGLTRAAAPVTKPAIPETVDILVAARPLAVGETVGRQQVRWQAWPRGAVPSGSLTRLPGTPEGSLPVDPAPARSAMLEGEPVAASKLASAGSGSPLAHLLAPTMRAVAVPIREETSAGGFIQASDHVDVIVTAKRTDSGREAAHSEILLRAVRVLAVGKALSGKAGGSRTATLELTPGQARMLISAQATGEISLSLIGTGEPRHDVAVTASVADPATEIRVMKYGRPASRLATQ